MSESCAPHRWSELLPDSAAPCAEDAQALLRAADATYRFPESEAASLESLDEALAGLTERPMGFWEGIWERVARWLQSLSEGEQFSWIDWVSSISVSKSFWDWLLLGTVTLIIVLSLWIVWREVRALRHRRRVYQQPAWDGEATDVVDAPGIEALADAEPRFVPTLAMAIVVDRLRLRRLIPDRDNLTHRQVLGSLESQAPPESLRDLAEAAERSTYGGWCADLRSAEAIKDYLPQLIADIETRGQ